MGCLFGRFDEPVHSQSAINSCENIRTATKLNSSQLLFSYTFVYASACTCTRLSILFFYRRIFSPLESWLKVAILAGGFLTLSYPLIVWITMANVCRPVSFFWTQFSGTTKGECINANMFFLAAGILNMINDFLILLIPFPRIIKLQMSKKKKAAICAIMAVGMLCVPPLSAFLHFSNQANELHSVCIASILRIHFLSIFMTSIDVTFLMGPVFIWSSIEPSVAIVCACLPHLSPLARLAHRSIASSFHSKRSKYASGPGTGAGASVQGRSRRGTLGERGGKFDGYAGGLGQRRKNADASEDEISLTNYSGRT